MLKDNFLQVDASHIKEGYIIATNLLNTKQKIKLEVKKNKKIIYYNFTTKSIQVPLQFGKGYYYITLYKSVSSGNYIPAGHMTINAQDMYENAYMLESNQYVQCKDVNSILSNIKKEETQLEQFYEIKKYIKNNYHYNYVKAIINKKDTLPDIPQCISSKSGICYDLAAMAVALLRSFKIPASLIIGKADKQYHAWVNVLIDGKEILYDPTADCIKKKKKSNYIEEKWY